MVRGHPPPHCENTQVLREAITEDDDEDPEPDISIQDHSMDISSQLSFDTARLCSTPKNKCNE